MAFTCQCHRGVNDTNSANSTNAPIVSSDVCEEVSSVKVDCILDGIPITKEMLKNIVSGKVPPITKPLTNV